MMHQGTSRSNGVGNHWVRVQVGCLEDVKATETNKPRTEVEEAATGAIRLTKPVQDRVGIHLATEQGVHVRELA